MKTFPYSEGRAALAKIAARKKAVPVKVVSAKKYSKKKYPLTKTFRLKRTFSQQANLTSSGNPQFTALTVSLSQFPGIGDVTALFDKYRIVSVTVRFIPMQRVNVTANSLGQIATIIDNDDSNTPADFGEMRQYPSYRTKSVTDYHTVTFKPYVSNAVYTGSAFTGYGSMKDAWIDMNSTGVVHYGLKYGIQNCNVVTGTLLYDIELTAVIEFQKVR